MDDMQVMDLCVATKYLAYAEVAQWNQTRHVMLTTLRPYLKKKDLTAQELFPLPIDEDDVEHTTEVTNKELEWFKHFKEQYNSKS